MAYWVSELVLYCSSKRTVKWLQPKATEFFPRNNSEMTQSFCHADGDAFDLIWQAPRGAIAWWMVCCLSHGQVEPHQTQRNSLLLTLLCCTDGTSGKADIWLQSWWSERYIILVISSCLMMFWCVGFILLCLRDESMQKYKHVTAAGTCFFFFLAHFIWKLKCFLFILYI